MKRNTEEIAKNLKQTGINAKVVKREGTQMKALLSLNIAERALIVNSMRFYRKCISAGHKFYFDIAYKKILLNNETFKLDDGEIQCIISALSGSCKWFIKNGLVSEFNIYKDVMESLVQLKQEYQAKFAPSIEEKIS